MLNMPVYILLQLVKHNSTAHQVLLYVFLFLAGVAGTLRDVSLMVVVTDVVEGLEKDWPGIFGEQGGTGQAYGLYNVAWSGGQVLGPLFAGYLVEARGWATLVTVFGVMSGVTAVVLGATGRESIWRRGWSRGEESRERERE
jgi:MFS family permease